MFLDLSDNHLGEKSAQAFRRNLNDHDGNTGNHALQTLSLRRCGLDDACFLQIAKGLMSTKSLALSRLDIRDNKMTATGLDHLVGTISKRYNLTQRLRFNASGQSGIKDSKTKELLEMFYYSQERPRDSSASSSAAASSRPMD